MDGKVGGVDEAGRGSVLGPLVISGVSVLKSRFPMLERLGVKDSKLLTPMRRSLLYDEIRRVAEEISILKVSPSEIDEYVMRGIKYRRLNFLEAKKMGALISRLGADEVYVDAPDINLDRFSDSLQQFLTRKVRVICRHHEDRENPIVAAASIIAKVSRDREIEKLRRSYGDFGSGYPSDTMTVEFLFRWVLEKGQAPPFARRSWKTFTRISRKITDY